MKRFVLFLIVAMLCLTIVGCVDDSSEESYTPSSNNSSYNSGTVSSSNDYSGSSSNDYSGSSSNDYSGSSSSGSFTNDYGTSSTTCSKPGCYNKIASSGDTAYCVTHSNKCLECYRYIDGDAMYCMDCLSSALYNDDDDDDYSSGYGSSYGSGYGSSYGSGYGSSSSSGHSCYVCGSSAYSKYGSYYYCSSCLALVKAFS